MADVLYFNGRFTTTDERVIGVEDRGFQFGDAIYEAMKFLRRAPLLIEPHFRRMQASLAAMEMPAVWSQGEFVAVLRELLSRTAFEEGLVYIQISRGEGERAHFYPEEMKPTVVAYTRRFAFPDAGKKEKGISVITTEDLRWKLCSIKSTNLLGNALVKKKAQRAGADEAILLSESGDVREGASSNFFAVSGDRIITHPLEPSILAGTVRDQVIALALANRIRVDERAIRADQLFAIDEAFITNTTGGVMPVTSIDGRLVGNGRIGAVTLQLQELYDQLEQREIEKFTA
jgi:D-alanine transaminase